MPERDTHHKFSMTEPGEYGHVTRFAFWFTTVEPYLLDILQDFPCVDGLELSPFSDHVAGYRALVDISDGCDPDEAWHWIRTDLEEEVTTVRLDSIWHEAIKWLL